MRNRVILLVLPVLLVAACSSTAHETAEPSLSPAASTPVDAPSPTPVATTPAPSRAPSPSPSPTASPTTPPGPAESVTTRSGVSTLTARIDHGSAPTSTLLHLHLQVSSTAGAWNGGTVQYGDGQRYDEPMAVASCVQFGPSGPPPAGPSSRTEDLVVSYRVPGRYTIDVRATTDSMCARGPTEQLHAQLQVLVTPGPRRANGPQLPGTQAVVAGTPVSGGTELEAFQLGDPDGVVTTVRWDLGDGTRTTSHVTGGCTDPGTRWPIDKSEAYAKLVHRYAHGTYRVRITVLSSGCHGGDQQRNTRTSTIHV